MERSFLRLFHTIECKSQKIKGFGFPFLFSSLLLSFAYLPNSITAFAHVSISSPNFPSLSPTCSYTSPLPYLFSNPKLCNHSHNFQKIFRFSFCPVLRNHRIVHGIDICQQRTNDISLGLIPLRLRGIPRLQPPAFKYFLPVWVCLGLVCNILNEL